MTRLKGSPYDIETRLRPEGAAHYLGIDPRTLSNWMRAGIGPRSVRELRPGGLNHAVRFRMDDLRRFVGENSAPDIASPKSDAAQEKRSGSAQDRRVRRVQLLLAPALYDKAKEDAARLGLSFNEYVVKVLEAFR